MTVALMCMCGHAEGDHVIVRRPGRSSLAGTCFVCECSEFQSVADGLDVLSRAALTPWPPKEAA